MRQEKSKIKGTLDGLTGPIVGGWVWDPENPEKRLEVVVYVDGEPVAKGIADLYRKNLEKAGIGDGRYGFRIELPKDTMDNKIHEIRAKVEPYKIELHNSPLEKKLSPIYGKVEKINPYYISGFAIDLTNPFRSLTVTLSVNDKELTKTTCNIKRENVLNEPVVATYIKDIEIKSLFCGFKLLFTKKLKEEILKILKSPTENKDITKFKVTIEDLEIELKESDINVLLMEDVIKEMTDLNLVKILVKQKAYEEEVELSYKFTQERDIKLIAFYLPQFYPFSENNEWWGEGFTEWTQIINTKPLFKGHYQPRLPADLGFYDLRLREVRKKQEMLAKEFGIYGFCYYYYWFSGKTLMDQIIKDILTSGVPDLPFCLCWANEPWSRRWDGSDQEVLMPQLHDLEIDEKLILDIMPYLKDTRYIKIDGKPILIVYNVERIPDPNELFRRWQMRAREEGLPGLHIVIAQTFGVKEPYPFGADAAVEFPPHQVVSPEITKELTEDVDFKGHIFDYREVVAREILKTPPSYLLYRTLMTSWDNSPRRGQLAHIFHNSAPEYYEIWLRHLIDYTRKNLPSEHRFIFINAWNEWAESTYLEPDRKYGKAYLQATKRALSGNDDINSILNELLLYARENPQLEKISQSIINYLTALQKTYNTVMKNIEGYLKNVDLSISHPMEIPDEVPITEFSKKINFNIERINQFVLPRDITILTDKSSLIEINGWFVIDGFDENFLSYFLFESNDEKKLRYLFPIKNRFALNNINEKFGKSSNYKCGFNQKLNLQKVEKGNYAIHFLFTNGETWFKIKTNIELEVVTFEAQK